MAQIRNSRCNSGRLSPSHSLLQPAVMSHGPRFLRKALCEAASLCFTGEHRSTPQKTPSPFFLNGPSGCVMIPVDASWFCSKSDIPLILPYYDLFTFWRNSFLFIFKDTGVCLQIIVHEIRHRKSALHFCEFHTHGLKQSQTQNIQESNHTWGQSFGTAVKTPTLPIRANGFHA